MTQRLQISKSTNLDVDGLTWFDNVGTLCSLCMDYIDGKMFLFFRDNKQIRLHETCFEKRKIRDEAYYWRVDSSGVMIDIVPRFLKQEPISEQELRIIKRYIHNWILALRVQRLQKLLDKKKIDEYEMFDKDIGDLLTKLKDQNTPKDLLYFVIDDCSSVGIQPF